MKFIPYFRPRISQEEIDEVVDSLKSGWLTTGPKTAKFESKFQEFLGGNVHCMAVNSATAGLHLALKALDIGDGDEVITSTHTFTATAAVIKHVNAIPVLCDISEDDFCISPIDIESKIGPKTKAIIVVHFAGQACKMNEILSLAKKYNLKVIEDAAHALPATYQSELVGKLGSDITVFSFYANKTITTGEGGMVVTRSDEIAQKIKIWRSHGISKDAFNRFSAEIPSWHYDVIVPGYKYNLTDIASSIGVHQLERAMDYHKIRNSVASYYDNNLTDEFTIKPKNIRPSDIHAWHVYNIRVKNINISRNDVIQRLFESGVGVSVHYIPLHMHSYWRNELELKDEWFPNSTKVFNSSFSLPIFPDLSDIEVSHIVSTLNKILHDFAR